MRKLAHLLYLCIRHINTLCNVICEGEARRICLNMILCFAQNDNTWILRFAQNDGTGI